MQQRGKCDAGVDTAAQDAPAGVSEDGPIGTADTASSTVEPGGALWHDGTLSYGIEVHGNRFTQTGGDVGVVTGTFFGPAHEGMGGVLVRDDLSAGFGGER